MIELSPSKLSVYVECPRCFWLMMKENLRRPQGPFPSLPGGMDKLIKKYFDGFRRQGEMPPEIKGKVRGSLIENQELLDKWRNWRTGLKYKDKSSGVILSGALDECFVDGDIYIPVDYKTRGYKLKEDTVGYFQNQIDCYALLLEKNGYKTNSTAYLVYYIPRKVSPNGAVTFNIEVIKLKTETNRALKIIRDASQVLTGEIPPPGKECEFCSYITENLKLYEGG